LFVRLKMLLGLAVILAGCGGDGLGELEPGERGRVVRIIDGDSLVLDTGLRVRLVGIEAPRLGSRERDAEPHARKARRLLEDLALGREVQVHYAGLTRDRYDRALGHLLTVDRLGPQVWLNRAMLVRGGARMRIYPDTARASAMLAAAEAEAQKAERGLWARLAYRPQAADTVDTATRGFLLIEGMFGPPRPAEDDETACLRDLMASPMTVEVAWTAAAACDLEAGHRVIVRGYVRARRLDLVHMANLEVLPRPASIAQNTQP